MSGCSKKDNEIYLENAFEQKKKNPGLKFNLRLALYNRPSNNWTLGFVAFDARRTHPNLLGVLCHKAVRFFSLCALFVSALSS